MRNPWIDVWFSVTVDGDATGRFFKGADEVSVIEWWAAADPREWWL